MFSSISWTEYFTFLLIALVIYYITVALLFYRKELAAVIRKGRSSSYDMYGMPSIPVRNENTLLEELREVYHATMHREFPKEELMLTIIQKVKQYSGINKELVNQFLTEAFPQLEERDRHRIWQ